ncbi:hypothetical protein U9M48_017008 [Paspalum notatum var. saurae]|uniref:Uncharacterized protein n=1 Tax=Paspalum notatum var. saurae TaxID=547442 RepID=A0AAQ3WNV9_PASNO
MLVRRWSTLR